MATSNKQDSYSIIRVILLTFLLGIFALMGTVSTIELLLRVLPSTEIKVDIVGRDSRDGGIRIGRGSGSGSRSYYVTLRDKNGKSYKVKCPEALHKRGLPGLSKLSDIRMKVSSLATKPIEVSMASSASSIVKEGTILHRMINMGEDASSRDEEAIRYPLLMPLAGALFCFVFFWGVLGVMIWKLLNKAKFNWVIFSIGMLLAIAGGGFWELAE